MHSVITATAGTLAMALVLYQGLARFPLQIERHVFDSARASLASAGMDWAALRISGRDLHLAGLPPDLDAHHDALRLLQGVPGVRVVVDATNRSALVQQQAPRPAPAAPRSSAPRSEPPPGSAPSPDQAARLCQSAFDALLAGQGIRFVADKTQISRESAELLQQVALAADRCAGARLEVAAHTDATGDPAENFARSQARAEAVVDYLVGQGVERARLKARGYGAQAPVASNRSAAGRSRNRRVEITVLRDSQ